MDSAGLVLSGVSKRFGAADALRDVSLSVGAGEMISILGPSGCGKSTLLRVIAGLEQVDQGSIVVDGRPVDGIAPKDRQLAFVFQNYALYPHLTCWHNIAAPLVMTELSMADRLPFIGTWMPRTRDRMRSINDRVHAMARLLEIEPFLERKPAQLSGGQRQRVALGRALVRDPKLFLLDEPLANLDAALRVQTRSELRALQRRIGATTLFVTHDQAEAMAISDRIAVMFDGQIRQIGTPDDIYRRPSDIDVARFLSQPHLNVVKARTLRRAGALLADASLGREGIDTPRVVAFRPEACSLHPAHDRHGLPVTVKGTEYAGAEAYVFVELSDGVRCVVRIPSAEILRWSAGQLATLRVDLETAWFFPDTEPDRGHAGERRVA